MVFLFGFHFDVSLLSIDVTWPLSNVSYAFIWFLLRKVFNAVVNVDQVEERVRKKGRDFYKSKTGSVLAFKVSFRE